MSEKSDDTESPPRQRPQLEDLSRREQLEATDANAAADEQRRRRRRRQQPRPPPSDYVGRAELLILVPLAMSTIDSLEKRGIFPSRFRLEPTTRVAWKRREVMRFMEDRAKKYRTAIG